MSQHFSPSTSDIDNELYQRVINFVVEQTNASPEHLTLTTRLAQDVGLSGDDADHFFDEFHNIFQVNMAQSCLSKSFVSEFPYLLPIWLIWRVFKPDKFNAGGGIKLIPVTLSDLYLAAKEKEWPDISNREPE